MSSNAPPARFRMQVRLRMHMERLYCSSPIPAWRLTRKPASVCVLTIQGELGRPGTKCWWMEELHWDNGTFRISLPLLEPHQDRTGRNPELDLESLESGVFAPGKAGVCGVSGACFPVVRSPGYGRETRTWLTVACRIFWYIWRRAEMAGKYLRTALPALLLAWATTRSNSGLQRVHAVEFERVIPEDQLRAPAIQDSRR